MNKIYRISNTILNSPYTSMFLAIVFLYTSIDELIDNYNQNIKGLTVHHGLALYGLIMFLRAILNMLKAVSGMEAVQTQVKTDALKVKHKIENEFKRPQNNSTE